jgi:hypothetical protein
VITGDRGRGRRIGGRRASPFERDSWLSTSLHLANGCSRGHWKHVDVGVFEEIAHHAAKTAVRRLRGSSGTGSFTRYAPQHFHRSQRSQPHLHRSHTARAHRDAGQLDPRRPDLAVELCNEERLKSFPFNPSTNTRFDVGEISFGLRWLLLVV